MRKLRLLVLVSALAWGCGGAANRYQGMNAEALFAMAQNEFAEEDYDNAIRTLDRLLLAFGDWARLPEARLMLAQSYFEKEEFITARSEYDRFLDRYAGHPMAPEAALGRCRALAQLAPDAPRDQAFTRDAVTACRNAVSDYRGTPQAEEAERIAEEMRRTLAEKELLNADFYFRRDFYDSAIMYYQFVVDLYPDTPYAPQALLGIYRSNMEIGYDDLAQEAKERLLAEYPDSEAAAEVLADGPAPDEGPGQVDESRGESAERPGLAHEVQGLAGGAPGLAGEGGGRVR